MHGPKMAVGIKTCDVGIELARQGKVDLGASATSGTKICRGQLLMNK